MRYTKIIKSSSRCDDSHPEEGKLLLRRSLRLKYKRKSLSNSTSSKNRLQLSGKQPDIETCIPWEQIAESVLCDYNKKNGTELEFVSLLDGKGRDLYGPGYTINFGEQRRMWKHFNFVARRHNADPSDKPFRLFAEVYQEHGDKYYLTALSLVKPTDKAYGCRRCWSYINHPRHGFRAGFNTKMACLPKMLPEQDAIYFAEFALKDYNEKNGTSLKFVRALQCNKFTCEGLLMDFNKKNTIWVHMNLEARVGPKEDILALFAEFYFGDGDNLVLATLSPAEPSDDENGECSWKYEFLNVDVVSVQMIFVTRGVGFVLASTIVRLIGHQTYI
ncbi:hypothetical protein OROMI_008987 [Orobanche minor]